MRLTARAPFLSPLLTSPLLSKWMNTLAVLLVGETENDIQIGETLGVYMWFPVWRGSELNCLFTRHLKQMRPEWVAPKVLRREWDVADVTLYLSFLILSSRKREWKERGTREWPRGGRCSSQQCWMYRSKLLAEAEAKHLAVAAGAGIQNQWMNYWYAPWPHA